MNSWNLGNDELSQILIVILMAFRETSIVGSGEHDFPGFE